MELTDLTGECSISHNRIYNNLVTLVDEYDSKKKRFEARQLKFNLNKKKDVYNPSQEFYYNDAIIVAARVELREDESDSEVRFFEKNLENNEYYLRTDLPVFKGQDPCISFVDDNVILGYVEVFTKGKDKFGKDKLGWRTIFYKGKDLSSLESEPFFVGPDNMKDIRLCQLDSGEIICYTRPQGKNGGKGKIGYFKVNSLSDLKKKDVYDAQIIQNQFYDKTWGGANHIITLDNNITAVFGHVATSYFVSKDFLKKNNINNYSSLIDLVKNDNDFVKLIVNTTNNFLKNQKINNQYYVTNLQEVKNYYSMFFLHNHSANITSRMKIIAGRDMFSRDLPAKKVLKLDNVLFTGGVNIEKNGLLNYKYIKLMTGISDTTLGCVKLYNPIPDSYRKFNKKLTK